MRSVDLAFLKLNLVLYDSNKWSEYNAGKLRKRTNTGEKLFFLVCIFTDFRTVKHIWILQSTCLSILTLSVWGIEFTGWSTEKATPMWGRWGGVGWYSEFCLIHRLGLFEGGGGGGVEFWILLFLGGWGKKCLFYFVVGGGWAGGGGAGYWPFEGIFGATFKTDYFWGSNKILGNLWGVGYCKNRG